MEYKPKYGWLYVLIILCVLFSAVMTWSLVDKLVQQRESEETYSELSSEVVVTGMTEFPSVTTTPATTDTGSEEEDEDQSDTIFYFDHDVIAVYVTPTPEPTALPAETPAETGEAVTVIPAPTGMQTAAPAETWVVIPAASTPAVTETVAPVETPAETGEVATATPTGMQTAVPAETWVVIPATVTPTVTETVAPAETPAETGEAATVPPTPTGMQTAVPAETWVVIPATVTPTVTETVAPAETPAETGEAATAPPAPTGMQTAAPAETWVVIPATATPAASETAAPTESPGKLWEVVVPTPTEIPTPTPTATPTATPAPTPTAAPMTEEELARSRVVLMDTVHYSVDFAYLQTLNEDVKAWLVQDGTVINYPVLQGEDNDYYLNHLFNGRINKNGSIFLDSGSSDAFGDANTYIYGHHTKTDAMFSTIVNYKEQEYYDEHPQLILLTPYGDYCIDLFAGGVFLADDDTSWRVKQFTRKADFDEYIQQLEDASLFKANEDSMPEWGDQLLVLVTCTNDKHGERYVVYGRMRQIIYASSGSVTVTKMLMDQKETISGWQEVPGRGQMMVYAQNDPVWKSMYYENRGSAKRRTFGAGGCGPTSVAMAVVNMVPKERLSDIFGYAKTSMGYTFCECSVNQYFCNKTHTQYQIQTVDEYIRYYPLVMANFATGNNLWDQVSRNGSSGTSLNFLKKIAFLYKLALSHTSDENEAAEAVRNGATAICSLGVGNPFTGGGHYVVMASVVDDYAYFLDPYRQDNYDKHDTDHLLTMIAPGVVRVELKNIGKLHIGTDYLLNTTELTAFADPPSATE